MPALKTGKRVVSACATGVFALLFAMQAFAQKAPEAIRLAVDATNAPQKILHTTEEIPVHPGPLMPAEAQVVSAVKNAGTRVRTKAR